MKNLKQIRYNLSCWGKFWAKQQTLSGYASKSNVEKLREVCELGGWSHSSVAGLSDSIFIPEDIAFIGKQVDKLGQKEKLVLIGKYIKKKSAAEIKAWANFDEVSSVKFWLLRAERSLL